MKTSRQQLAEKSFEEYNFNPYSVVHVDEVKEEDNKVIFFLGVQECDEPISYLKYVVEFDNNTIKKQYTLFL